MPDVHTSNRSTPYVGEWVVASTIKLQINTIKRSLMAQKNIGKEGIG